MVTGVKGEGKRRDTDTDSRFKDKKNSRRSIEKEVGTLMLGGGGYFVLFFCWGGGGGNFITILSCHYSLHWDVLASKLVDDVPGPFALTATTLRP